MSERDTVPGPAGIGIASPQAVLEAGGKGSTVLIAAIDRRVTELGPGQVLEVVSLAANACLDAAAWCHVTGHELLGLLSRGDETRFWIRKRSAEAAAALEPACGAKEA
jgi:TusA-related sulfurtransferase